VSLEEELRAGEVDVTNSTTVSDINHGEGSQIANQDRKIEDRALGSGQDSEDTHDLVQSRRSRGMS
jgi:hypothetical protein